MVSVLAPLDTVISRQQQGQSKKKERECFVGVYVCMFGGLDRLSDNVTAKKKKKKKRGEEGKGKQDADCVRVCVCVCVCVMSCL